MSARGGGRGETLPRLSTAERYGNWVLDHRRSKLHNVSRLTLGPDAVAEPEEFIFAMVKWGEHYHSEPRSWSLEQLRERIPEWQEMIDDVRKGHAVKYFENLLGATWHTMQSPAAAGGVGVRNLATGEEHILTGPGVLELSSYAAIFETAVGAWQRAIERASHAELLTALRDGVSSIEAFVNSRAAEWNGSHPDQQFEDRPGRFTTFPKKIKEWCHQMTGERIADPEEARLLSIKRYRDDVAVHPKHSVIALNLEGLAQLLNRFTFDIAVPFFSLHRTFRVQVPAVVLRAAYAPLVGVAHDDTTA